MNAEMSTIRHTAAPRRQHTLGQLAADGLHYLALILLALVMLIPFAWMLSTSLKPTEYILRATPQFIPDPLTLDSYTGLLDLMPVDRMFFNSTLVAVIGTAGQILVGAMAAYAFARMSFPGKDFLFALLLSTLILPEAITWVPNFITVVWLGRVTPISWINNWPSLTIPFMASAFSILLLRQFFQQIPEELWDSARIDGAGHIRYLLRVVVPLSRAALVTIVLFSFIGSWNALAWPILVTTTPDWRPISYGLLNFLDESGAQNHLRMAGAVITIFPLIVLYFFTQKQFTEGIATTGLKG